MDDPFAGDDRRHKSWRDLPPTPPLVWPTTVPAFATATAGVPVTHAPRTVRRPGRRFLVGTALVVGALVVAASGVLNTSQRLVTQLAPAAAAASPDAPDGAAGAVPPADEPLAKTAAALLPSVVQIEAGNAMGSGFVAADEGLILTASHVVGRSDTVTLRLYDGSTVPGTIVAVDKSIDTAVIRADQTAGTNLKPLTLGALANVHVGDTTIAVGSPFGLSQTVTTGIVSALGRTVPTQVGELHDLIQTDAAINSGNSGGPLADREGRAIGINTAIASASGGSDGIGFAVPIDRAIQMLDKVKAGTWKAEDNDPADLTNPLGGGLDQFLGPKGLDGLRDLFGLGPDGPQTPDGSQTPNGQIPQGPSDGSGMADQMLRQMLQGLMQELERELEGDGAFRGPAPNAVPGPEAAPAPGGTDDPAADMQRLMQELFGELFQGMAPNGDTSPVAPGGTNGAQGA
ncbi:MAG TPA: trypsin-like peptidase domain-containing protein [Candidatus Limnocylindrales bacterium]|nr:trypsin-like peptidase domain-containing protein [Candidatus Limnocylindrales bacterium]